VRAVSAALKRLGRYDLIRPIATGGMAEIYLAAARGMEGCNKLVVIKRMLPKLAVDAEHVTMFLEEARMTAQLSHSNIVHFYDLEARDGEFFIVMELLRGCDVLQLLKASIVNGRPFPLDAALVIGLGVCAALHYAHEKIGTDGQPLNIVHRDVSPANVFVTFAGGVKLLDFGVARAEGRDRKTQLGVIKGKLCYLSPEQARGEPVDCRSDIFSLAILLWELTTRTKLFRGADDYSVLQAILERDATPPSAVCPNYPPELERIVMKGLRRNPKERYQTAQEVQIDLEQFAIDHDISTSPRSVANLVKDLIGAGVATSGVEWQQIADLDDPVTVSGSSAHRELGVDATSPGVPPSQSRARLVALSAVVLLLCAIPLALWWLRVEDMKLSSRPTSAVSPPVESPVASAPRTLAPPPAPDAPRRLDKTHAPARATSKPKRHVGLASKAPKAATPSEEDDDALLPP
jgi:serine/threonine protein kinase